MFIRHPEPRPGSPWRARLVAACAVFALAAAVRIIFIAQIWDHPLFRVPMLDADAYWQLARQFADGQWLAPEGKPYWQPPFYPAALGIWIKMAGPAVRSAGVAQCLLGAFNCSLVCLLGWRVFGRSVGIASGAAAALYGPFLFFDSQLLTPTLQISLNLLAMLTLLVAVERKSTWAFAASGLLLGLSAITRPDVLLFAAAAGAWAAASMRGSGRARSVGCCAVLAVAVALPIAAVAVRNSAVGKDRVLISSNGGLNFYIGNNARERLTRELRPGPEWDRLLAMAEAGSAKPSAKSAFFYRKGLEYILDHPAGWAALMVKKAVMFLTAIEGRRNLDPYLYRSTSSLYAALVFHTGPFAFPLGIVLPLAVLGTALRRRGPAPALMYIYLAAQFAAVVLFFVCARYRLPAVPVLLIFAALGALELARAVRERRLRALALPIALAAAAFGVSNANLYRVDADRSRIDSETYLYTANALQALGDDAGAAQAYRRTLQLDPRNPVSRLGFADVLTRMRDLDGAERQLRAALRADPESAPAHFRLGQALQEKGSHDEAAGHFIIAARADERFIDQLVQFTEAAYARGEYAAAERAIRQAVRMSPEWADARRTLGVVLMKMGRIPESIAQLERARNLDPEWAECLLALGMAYELAGRHRDADLAFERAIEAGPADMRRRIDEFRFGLKTAE